MLPHIQRTLTKFGAACLGFQLFALPALAADAPNIAPQLRKAIGALPIAESKAELQAMMAALQKTSCGSGLTGCYMTRSGPLQMYLFSTKQAQQTALLVVDKGVAMPAMLRPNVQKLFGRSGLSSPIFSISTTDYTLAFDKMPLPLQNVVREHYFNAGALEFSSGVQVAARIDLGGPLRLLLSHYGVDTSKVTMRGGVMLPIPTDMMGGATMAGGVAEAMSKGDKFEKASSDALDLEGFVELQFPPGASITMGLPKQILTDATFFVTNTLTFGFKGNAAVEGAETKKVIQQFQTPITPEGVMDLVEFSFRMSTPQALTLEDVARILVASRSPDPRLAKYGGGFVRNIQAYQQRLLSVLKPLSAFQMRNPVPYTPGYRFGDPLRPFPEDDKYFNMIIDGPAVEGGPQFVATGDAVVLGQKMGTMDVRANVNGLDARAMADLSLKLGPLGKVTVAKVVAQATIDANSQLIRLKGNYYGQVVETVFDGDQITLNVPANCVNPFEIKAKLSFTPTTNLAEVFDAQGGANVDPHKIAGCLGKELEAALRKISGEYKNLSGYTAKEANEALKKMSGTAEYVGAQTQKQAEAAAAEAQKQAEAARKEYERTKNAARDAASKATNGAAKAFADAGNAFKRLGKKKKHKKGPDPKFAASVFDWDYYYDTRPDVVAAKMDLATHWKDHGLNEGARGSREFDSVFYWNRYTDVQSACREKDHACALQHWLDKGLDEGRQGSLDFSIYSLMKRYPDLQNAYFFYDDLMEWWLDDSNDNTRDATPLWVTSGAIPGPKRAGGKGGSPWTDRPFCQDAALDGVRLRAGKRVGWMQFRYGGRWADARGDQGDRSTFVEFTLPAGEHFTRVEIRAGEAIDKLKFFTNRGRTFGPYGGGGGGADAYDVAPGEKLGCTMGRQGSTLDSLTFTSTGPR